ncbi:MAG: nitrophenyl compound nitroreductase subunit ArsF family protein [Bacteroidales bacterium]
MKLIQLITFTLIMSFALSCNADANSEKDNNEKIQQAEKVEVYYFHNTRRCATCKTVENVAKEAVEEMDNEKVSFIALNLEKDEGKEKAKELGVSGQTLLVSGGKEKFNVTQDGFMHARSNPEKLKEIIQEKIKSLQ